MMRYFSAISGLLLAALIASPAHAEPKGEALLAKLDDALTRFKDQIFTFEMQIQDPGNDSRKLGLQVHLREKKRRVEFLYPGDVKGMKLLILSREKMYVYLPAYRKIRRIASHAREQSLFGADYSYDDMSTVTYGDVYKGKFVKETDSHFVVDGTPRPGAISPYGRIRFQIRKKDMLADRFEYFSKRGKHIKTETRKNFTCVGKFCNHEIMKMVDHTRNNHWTRMVRKSMKIDVGFSDRVFSRRHLQRAR